MMKPHQEDQDEPFFITEEVEVKLTAAGYEFEPPEGAFSRITSRSSATSMRMISARGSKAAISRYAAPCFSWVNDGSHSFNDDLYISADDAMTTRYLDVFRGIFEVTNHLANYEMMGQEAMAALALANVDAAIDIADDAV